MSIWVRRKLWPNAKPDGIECRTYLAIRKARGRSRSLPMGKSPDPIAVQGLGLVVGAGFAHQKRNFPPIDVIDLQFEYQGKALVPVGV